MPPSEMVSLRTSATARVQPQAGQCTEFDRGLFGRWLHMLLVAFYGDEEAVVADLLFRRSALVKDTVIGSVLGLPDRQVRQALERRLVPDSVVERVTEGVAPHTQTFYRICSAAVAVAARRLQALEDTLGSVTEDEYFCPKCRRSYNSLQAVSLTKHPKVKGGGAFAFLCEQCDEELTVASETAKTQHDRLQRFRTHCRDLLLLTRELRDMPIPQFPREAQAKKGAPAPASRVSAGTGAGSAPPAALEPQVSGVSALAAEPAAPRAAPQDAVWFHREILGADALCAGPAPPSAAAPPAEDSEAVLREALEQARGRLQEELAAKFLQGLAGRASDVRRRAVEGVADGRACEEDPAVSVQGRPHPLSRVREDEDLQDAMTDEEYQRFVDLDRRAQQGREAG